MKIGIELPDEKLNGIDFSNPELGNPGVGGSEYLFSLLSKELYKKGKDIIVYHYGNNKIYSEIKCRVVKDTKDLLIQAEQDNIDILIHQVGKDSEWYNHIEKSNIYSVAWAHVYLEYEEIKALRICNNVKRIVFVGKEEYDSYIDDDIIAKSTFIYNMIPTNNLAMLREREIRKPIVTYIGSLVPQKGFHRLAQIWPYIIKEVPNAELNIIGTGKVYDRNARLGKYGIAEQKYEEKFMKYLTDEKGNIFPFVHFLGIIGSEKNDILNHTKVGVVNPTALTETFCMSAVEMEYYCVPVVSRKKWGLLDTVKNNSTGFLFRNNKEFIKKMVLLLKDDSLNSEMGNTAHKFVIKNFSVDVVMPEWIKMLDDIIENNNVEYKRVEGNFLNDYKWIKLIIRFFRINLRLRFLPSFQDFKSIIKKLVHT